MKTFQEPVLSATSLPLFPTRISSCNIINYVLQIFGKYEPSVVWLADSWHQEFMSGPGRTDDMIDYVFGDMTDMYQVFLDAMTTHCAE